MSTFLTFIKGKKSTIGTVLGLIITYSLSQGFIGGNEANLLASILVALGVSVNVAEHVTAK